jgi:hypothetical protein
MKNQILNPVAISFMLALVSLSISAAPPHKPDNGFTYKIGATGPGGGYIFFVDNFDQYPGFTYLEAAPEDASAGIAWCNETTTSIFAGNEWDAIAAVGRGRANTDAMLRVCSSGAARAADNYTTGSTQAGDWFLPSEGELMLMYTNLRQAGVGSFALDDYWSSMEYSTAFSSVDAGRQSFLIGSQLYGDKRTARRVRAARAF